MFTIFLTITLIFQGPVCPSFCTAQFWLHGSIEPLWKTLISQ